MNKNSPLYDDEIDLIALFKIIWDGKIKILLITLISFFVGFGYNSQIPVNYLNSLTINLSNDIELTKLAHIKKLIRSNQSNIPRFINELKDYEEFLLTIKNTKKIQENISKLNTEDQEIELFKYAKLLEIVKPKKNKESFTIDFKWHDPYEAKKILQETLNLTSKNLKRSIALELSQLLEFEKKLLINKDAVKLDYLKEQSSIAKELNIIDNQIDNVNLSQSNVSLNISTADIAYYLRGYKAIDKEIELIENRDHQNLKFIEQEINDLKNKEIEFVKHNVYLMDHISLKNTKLILVISILLGLIVGIFYVLISNAFSSKKGTKRN
ncbi:Wzz/FepE/Etk N-terminal domain-containing protein [Pelagibacteraceae bacterium]|nr:Wzz/FepE/Etk N-terminal domain-containing protein [Pelagibacteraceae bacterium]